MAVGGGILRRKLAIWLAVCLLIFVAGFFVLLTWSHQLAATPIIGYAFLGIWLGSGFVIAGIVPAPIARLLGFRK